jgi:hypothetical protein
MKEQADYLATWHELWDERSALHDKRTCLENELSDVNTRLSHLDEILEHLSPLAGVSSDKNISGLGITDAIRTVLRTANVRMSANDVRLALLEKGFDLSSLSAPMSSIYKILGRLVDSKEVDKERDDGDSRVFYLWKTEEITDDDIPF